MWSPTLGLDANNVLYIAGNVRDSSWLFTSIDQGITLNQSPWTAHGVLAFHPFGNGRMYARAWQQLAYTDDAGTSWNFIVLPADTTQSREMAITEDTTLYIITEKQKLLVGRHNGRDWHFDTRKEFYRCNKVMVSGESAYLLVEFALYKTTDRGLNWDEVITPPQHKWSTYPEFALLPSDNKLFTVHFGFSEMITPGDTVVTHLPLVGYKWTSYNDAAIDSEGKLYLAHHTGLYILQDDNTWHRTFGNDGQRSHADHVKPLSRNQIIVSNYFGKNILSTNDLTWSSEGLPFLQDDYLYDPLPGINGSTIYPTASNIYRTNDSGRNWERGSMPPKSNTIAKIIRDKSGTLHVTSQFNDQDIIGWPEYFKSSDNGDTWLPESDTAKERYIAQSSKNVWYEWGYKTPPYYSIDNGKSWRSLGDSIECRNLFIAPNDDVHIFTENSLLISSDRGTTWQRHIMPMGNWVQDMVWDSIGRPYVAVRDESRDEHLSGVYMSTDSCKTWTKLDFHFMTPTTCTDLLYHADGRIYAATSKGVFRTVLPATALKLPKEE